jgi:tyrosyl-tRNA synthetase
MSIGSSSKCVLAALSRRNMLKQCSSRDALGAHLSSGVARSVYVGIDPTGDALHCGHLLPLMALKHMQAAGHRCVCV